MAYELLTWKAWAANATRDQVAEKLAMQQDEVVRLRESVKVLATNLRSYIRDQAVGDWTNDISDEVNANPIAAAAVREAGR